MLHGWKNFPQSSWTLLNDSSTQKVSVLFKNILIGVWYIVFNVVFIVLRNKPERKTKKIDRLLGTNDNDKVENVKLAKNDK